MNTFTIVIANTLSASQRATSARAVTPSPKSQRQRAPSPTTPVQPDLAGLDEHDWAEARRRLDLIGPLLDGARCPRAVIVERARSAGLDGSTLYRWARAYRASDLLSSLLPYKPSGGRGKSRLRPAVEQIVTEAIAEHFLTPTAHGAFDIT